MLFYGQTHRALGNFYSNPWLSKKRLERRAVAKAHCKLTLTNFSYTAVRFLLLPINLLPAGNESKYLIKIFHTLIHL